MKLERITKFSPAFDKRHKDPSKNYGIGAMRCFMVLKGKENAVHFIFSTGIYLPETVEEYYRDGRDLFHYTFTGNEGKQSYYMGHDVGYHSLVPLHDYQLEYGSRANCDWLDGQSCYGDGSALRADEWMDVFVREGSDKIWEMLEVEYKTMFGKEVKNA